MTELAHFDIVGSFLRPEELKQARDKFNHGDISQAELTQVENREIEKLIHTEENLGLKVVTDGEFRRSWWHLDFLWGLTGVKKYDYHESYKFHGAKTRTDNAELAGKVAYNPDHPFLKHLSLSRIILMRFLNRLSHPLHYFLEIIDQIIGRIFMIISKLILMTWLKRTMKQSSTFII